MERKVVTVLRHSLSDCVLTATAFVQKVITPFTMVYGQYLRKYRLLYVHNIVMQKEIIRRAPSCVFSTYKTWRMLLTSLNYLVKGAAEEYIILIKTQKLLLPGFVANYQYIMRVMVLQNFDLNPFMVKYLSSVETSLWISL